MKRPFILIGIILLAGGVLFEEKHRAETFRHHIVAPALAYRETGTPFLPTNSNFSDNVNLWDNPKVKSAEADLNYANLVFQNDAMPPEEFSTRFEKLQPGVVTGMEPAITILDREVAYALFAAKGFTLTLNLKPTYPSSQALIPTHIDAGLGGSISF